jgi:hypothetical protein
VGGRSGFHRILIPVRSPGQASPALAVAARLCAVAAAAARTGRFYRETPGWAAAVLEEALLMAWACGGLRATTAIVDVQRNDVALAIAWQAAAWPADLIVLARRPRPALARLV